MKKDNIKNAPKVRKLDLNESMYSKVGINSTTSTKTLGLIGYISPETSKKMA